ncbi:MAG: hypothetical protein IT165_23355 [Bryobacterales bacterium]|nr:hypothetical protein [Bryobacterales bacterium]
MVLPRRHGDALPANPQPGQAIADMDSGGFFQCVWQILSSGGKQDPEAANRLGDELGRMVFGG